MRSSNGSSPQPILHAERAAFARPSKEDVETEDGVILGANGVSVHFGGVRALSDIHACFRLDQVCGLIGPNGAGKTTLFDCLSGVLTPAAGEIHYLGEDISKRSSTWRSRRGIRRTFQRQQTFGWLSVEENVLVALEWRGGGGGLGADLLSLPSRRRREVARRARVDEVLELCDLTALRNQPAANLPIGRARMVELARAVVDNPQVLLLDEPTSGLEESEAEHLAQVVHRLRAEHRCAVVLVEHDIGFVMRHCDRILVLNLGELIADNTPEMIRADPAVRSAYLG